MNARAWTVSDALGILLVGVVGTIAATGVASEPAGMRETIEQYTADLSALKHFHRLPLCPDSDARFDRFYRRWESEVRRIEFDALGPDERIDYLLLRNHIQRERQRLAIRREAAKSLAPWVPFASGIVDLAQSQQRMKPIKPEAAAAKLAEIGRQIEQIQKRIEAGPDEESDDNTGLDIDIKDKTRARRAAMASDQLQEVLKRWYAFYDGYDPQMAWWASQPVKDVDEALQQYATTLRRNILGEKEGEEAPLIGDPIGREALLTELKYEWIPYTPDELIEIAQREFAWCDTELKRAAQELGHGDDWKAALQQVKQIHVQPGKQDDLVKRWALESIAFVEDRELVTVPPLCRELWTVVMIPREGQLTTPYMSYGPDRVNVAFPTAAMSHEQKLMNMRGNSTHFTRAVVHHELIPGHHLQSFMAARHRAYRRPFSTAFFIEGWALHWEMLLWDLDFARSAEDRVGMLFWRRHRCARIIVSLEFHLGKMSPAEMVDFLVDRVGHERDGATAEVRRYIGDEYGPLYQCAYMLGGLQVRALHKELVGSGKWTNQRFHDTLLRQNPIPVELIRARLGDQQLARDSASSWRFYDSASDESSSDAPE